MKWCLAALLAASASCAGPTVAPPASTGPPWPVAEQFTFDRATYTRPFALAAGQAWLDASCRGVVQDGRLEISQAPRPGLDIKWRGQSIFDAAVIGGRGRGDYFAVPDGTAYVAVVNLLGDASCTVEIRQQP